MIKPLLIFILLITVTRAYAQPSAAEYSALMDLYSSTGGSNWTNKTGWSAANPNVVQSVAGWAGVGTDSQGHITSLNLYGNNLSGLIPATIGDLTELTGLNLGENHLTGTIPSRIGDLTKLIFLHLRINQLTGPIPTQIGNLTQLTNLAIDNNQLSGSIPISIGDLEDLEWLWMGPNQLSGSIPSGIGDLVNLKSLVLEGNHLTGSIPSSFGNLIELRSLNLTNNNLSGTIPTSLGSLNNLIHLHLRINQLTGAIPSSFGNLSSLENLALDNNQLTGNIPPALEQLENLNILWLWANNLTGSIPSELSNLPSLGDLSLEGNNLSGPIPVSLGNLSTLIRLDLSNNQLTGSIPSSVGRLNNLQYLNLRINQLSGSIPDSIGNLASLKNLAIDNNQLTGSLPSSIGDLENLEALWLGVNQLSGNIPAEIGNLTKLSYGLILSNNNLTGSIPSSIGKLTNLTSLELSNNQLNGQIPSSIGKLNKLTFLTVSNNNLSGSIPDSIGVLSAITNIGLDGNELSGAIPTSIGNLENLRALWLSSNNLSGNIPEQLGNLQHLEDLRIAANNLTGPIPLSLADLQNLNTIYVNQNQFTFTDLVQFKNEFNGSTFLYTEQDSVDARKTLLATIGGPFLLTTNIDRATEPLSKYQWFKYANGVVTTLTPEPSTSGHTLTIPSITESDIGAIFYYRIYNDSIPSLVLTSRWQTLVLDSAGGGCSSTLSEEFSALMDLYNATNGAEWLDRTGWKDANPNVPQRVDGWYGIRTDANGHITDIDLDGAADFTYITNSQGVQVYTGNYLAGTIPTTIGQLSCLRMLNVGGNQLTGPLPDEIGQLTNLVWLIGSTNHFTGSLPASIGNLTKLDRIFLEKNQLTDSIPSSIGNLLDLWALLLNDNQLTGPIPSTLGKLKKLRFFYLYNNQLTGSIPEQLGAMTAAYRIGFQNNQLTGTIPASFANLSNLQLLYLSNNQLQGIVPPALSTITPLKTVVFDSNRFTFSSFLELKNSFSGTTFSYYPQGIIDEEKTLDGVIGESLTLTTQIDRSTTPPSVYQWFRVINGTSEPLNTASADGHSYTIETLTETDANADYYYTITNLAASGLVLTSRLQHLALSPPLNSVDVNYIRTIDVTVAGKTNSSQVESAPVGDRITNYTYFDGLGRPMQQVVRQGSPLKKDLVTPVIYDEFGREVKKYLPFVSGSNGGYKPNGEIIDGVGNYIGIAQPFYNDVSDAIADDPRPYSQIMFEPSPLNRPDKEYGPGQAWAPSGDGANNKFIQHNYFSNVHSLTGGGTAEAVIAWKVGETGVPVSEDPITNFIETGGYYSSNQIYVKSTLDEHGNAVREYTNKQGQVILKKVQVVANSTNLNNVDEWACTYYIYDDLGDLRFVLPPEGVKQYLEVTAQN